MSLTLYPLGDYLQLLQRKNLQLDFSGAPSHPERWLW